MTKVKETCCRKFEDSGRYCKSCPLLAEGKQGAKATKKTKQKGHKKAKKHGKGKGKKH